MDKEIKFLSTIFILYAAIAYADNDAECCETFNPPARPYNPDCWGFYIQIDPLIWQAHLNGANVAIQTNGSDLFFNQTGNNRVKNLNFNWDWGFRLGLGYNSCHDGWDALLQWTSWCTDASKRLTAPPGGALYPTRGVPAFIQDEVAQRVNAKWKMHYNILDLENGREFFVSSCLSLRPFAGLRSAWIKQQFDTLYEDLAVAGTFPIPHNSHSVDQEDRFWGIGIRGGVDIQWGLLCGWSLFSNYAASLLYAYHKVDQVEVTGPAGLEGEILDVSNFFHVGTAIFDMQLGIRWDYFFCCEQYHLGLDFGWELHWHPEQNQFLNFVDDAMPGKFISNQGDLGIQGFFLNVRFDF